MISLDVQTTQLLTGYLLKNSPAVLQKALWHPPSVLGGSPEQSGPGMQPQCRALVFGTLENMDVSGKTREKERATQCTPEEKGAWGPAGETQVMDAPAQADKEISEA